MRLMWSVDHELQRVSKRMMTSIGLTAPQRLAVQEAEKAVSMFRKLEVPVLGVVENMSHALCGCGRRSHPFGRGGGAALAARAAVPLLGELPFEEPVVEALRSIGEPAALEVLAPLLAIEAVRKSGRRIPVIFASTNKVYGGLDDLAERRVRFIGDPLQRIAEDHLRILRFFRFHARYGAGAPDAEALEACAARANDLMALSRERIADELLKLLAFPDPSPTVGIMLQRAILAPVLPEIVPERLRDLEALIAAERGAGVEPGALRRLAALLPADPALVERIAARLRLSNKARKRLASAAARDVSEPPKALAYWLGTETAVDRLLLAGRPEEARSIAGWAVPRLPIRGGKLIERGLVEGPIVARTIRRIEERWVGEGFPAGEAFAHIVDQALTDANAGKR